MASDDCKSFVPVEWDTSGCRVVVHDLHDARLMLPMSLDFLCGMLQGCLGLGLSFWQAVCASVAARRKQKEGLQVRARPLG
jgi:hypothetical protein